jgi:hypothetical protein
MMKKFYWEFVKIYYKILISVFISIFDTEHLIKGLLCVFTIITYYLLLMLVKPYKINDLTNLEIKCSFVVFTSILAALMSRISFNFNFKHFYKNKV